MPRRVLVINPNSAVATTAMMVGIAQEAFGTGVVVSGAEVASSPPMIVDPAALDTAAQGVIAIAATSPGYDGLIVAAFGDPGLDEVRAASAVPVVGIAESSILAAAAGGRRFGIATTTPALAARVDARVERLGLSGQYTGIRTTSDDPTALVAAPDRLDEALAGLVRRCIADGAEAIIIGGGPLGQAALRLQPFFAVPIIAPIQAAAQRLAGML